MANKAPWKNPAPSGMTAQHKEFAAQARKAHAAAPSGKFGFNPLATRWDYKGDQTLTTPVSNIAISELEKALTGRYYIYHPYTGYSRSRSKDDWSVMYFGADGQTYFVTRVAGALATRRQWAIAM